jgi:NADH-quinone oxidoreductase subunit M
MDAMTTNISLIPWLSLLLALPLAGALLCGLCGQRNAAGRWAALITAVLVLLIAIGLFLTLPQGTTPWLAFEDYPWINRFGVRFTLGMDSLSLLMIMLTGLLLVAAVLISWREEQRPPAYFALLLLSTTGIVGVFLALDLILFYICWEVMLIPLFFVIGIWGKEQRVAAAVKFFLFSLTGSLLMLLAIIGLYVLHGQQTGEFTFALAALKGTQIPPGLAPWLYGAFLLAFLIKMPVVPLHRWQPDAYSAAPLAATLLLAGVLAKTGVFGLIRFAFPLFPDQARASLPLLATLALLGILYAGWIAFVQNDLKRLVAYASVAHLGFIVLGLTSWHPTAVTGSMLQMLNHGLTTGALFIMVALYEGRTGSRLLGELGGLWGRLPLLSALFLLFAMATLGLPGLNNFAGEILILLGVFVVRPWWGALALGGLILAAAYMLRMVQGVIWGPAGDSGPLPDLSLREGLVLVPLAILVVWLGVYPETFLEPLRNSAGILLEGSSLLSLNGGLP